MTSGSKVLPSYREVFSVLEGLGSLATSPEEVEKLLGDCSDFLKGCLDSFKPPSSASKAAVESGTVSGYGDQPLNLNESIRKVTVEASTRLALDEVQTYALLRRCLDEDKSPLPTACDDDLVVRLTRYYFAERLQLMKCIQALLERGTDAEHDDDDDEVTPALAHARACLRDLLAGGLEEKLTGALCSHMRGSTPTRPAEYSKDRRRNAQLAKMWATQALEETQVMLDCAFYMYYSPGVRCSASGFTRLAVAFEEGAMGRAPASAAELVNNAWVDGERGEEYARETVNRFSDSFRAMCSVILIETMDLEDVVQSLNAADGGDTHAMLNVDAMKDVAKALGKWPSDATHGPVLLAWATLLSLAPSAASGLTPPPEADPAKMSARAAGGDAGFDSLLSLLRTDYIKGIGHACKSVLKNLFTASLAAFDVLPVQRLKPGELDTLLDILVELVEGQPILCEQFWGGSHGDGQEAPLMNLLVGCRERHPADGVPLLRALSALASGSDAAACALAFLSRSPTVALPTPGPGADMAGSIVPVGRDGKPTRKWKLAMERWEGEYADYEQRRDMGWGGDAPPAPPLPAGPVRSTVALASAYLPGAAIPAGARGVAIDRMGSARDAADEEEGDGAGEDDEEEDDENAVMATAGPATSGPGADIVTWDAPADGFAITIARLCVLSTAGAAKEADARELDAILSFIAKVLKSAPSFAAKFAAVDVSDGVPRGTPTTILAALTAVIAASVTPGRAWSTLPCAPGGNNHPGLERTALALDAAAPLASAAPGAALAQLTATPLLHADTGAPRGPLASMRAPGPAVGLAMFERSVLPAECTTGEYPVTLALLGLTAKLLWAGAGAAPAMTPILQHVFQEVLVQHGTWRYRRRSDRWAMHAALVRVIAAALAPRPGPANASRRAAVAGFVSSDAAAAEATLAPLTMDAEALRRMHDVRAAEVAAAEDAVAATLGMLPALMSAFAEVAKEKNSPSPLESGPLAHALLVEGPGGGSPLAAAVASYAAYPFDAVFRPLALPALAALCAAAPADPPLACALPSLASASDVPSAFDSPYKHKGDADVAAAAKLDVRAAIVNALKPAAARGDPKGFRAAAALVTAAAARQPMLAESMLIPAKLGAVKPDEEDASTLDSLYECLGEAKTMRANDPRSLASALKSLFSVWNGNRLLGGAVAALRSDSSFVSRLEDCLPVSAEVDGDDGSDDETEAYRFSVEAYAMSMIASELAASERDSDTVKSVRAWCDASGGESTLLRWLRRWMTIRHDPGTFSRARSHAQAVVLLAAAETEREGAADLPDASLRDGAAEAARALLSHAAAQHLLIGGQATRAAVLDAVAAGAVASAAGREGIRAPGDPVGRLLDAARSLRLERAVLAPPTPNCFDPEMGGDFLYDTSWIEVATGHARVADDDGAGHEVAFGSGGGGAEGNPSSLARAGGAAAEALRAAGRAAARGSSQLSALDACLEFFDAAAGVLPPVTHPEDDGFGSIPDAGLSDEGALSSWPAKERRVAVRLALEALEAAMVAANEEGADHAKALAVELAEMLAVLVRLWGRAIESPAAVSPSKVVGFGSQLNLPAGSTGSDDGELNAFTVASDVARVTVEVLSRRGDVVDGDTVEITRALLTAVLASIRAWRDGASEGNLRVSGSLPGSSPLREGNRLGQILWPLVPMLCGAASAPNGGTDSVLALSVLRELTDGLMSTPALVAAMQSRAPLPPLEPPRPPVSPSPLARSNGMDSSGQASIIAVPFKYLGDAPTMALRPFLELNATIDGADGKENLQRANVGPKIGAEGSVDEGVFGGVEVPAALRLCLVLGRSAEGAESLHRLGLIGQLTKLCKSLSGSTYHPAPAHQPSPRRGRGRAGFAPDEADELAEEHPRVDPAALYCLALRVAATHADAVGSKPEVHEGLVAMAVELADRFAAALAPAELTVAALAEAEATATLLHSLAAAANGPWQLKAPSHQVRMRASAVDFLRWIASPPPPRRGVACAPRGSAQASAARRPPLVGASTGWFHSCALGSVPPVAATPAAAIAAAVAANDRSTPAGNAHSENVAGRLYATAARCAAFLASFPRANPAAALGSETLDSLSGQAVALGEEMASRREASATSSAGVALCDALTMTAKSLLEFASALERLEAGEPNLPDPPALRLHSSYSLVSQMSWRESTILGDPK